MGKHLHHDNQAQQCSQISILQASLLPLFP